LFVVDTSQFENKGKLDIVRKTLIALISKLKDRSLFNVSACDP